MKTIINYILAAMLVVSCATYAGDQKITRTVKEFFAEPDSVIAGCWSYHYDFQTKQHNAQNYNETNECFGVSKGEFFAMTLRNSLGKRAFVFGQRNRPYSFNLLGGDLSVGTTLSLASGYGARGVGMILPLYSVTYQYDHVKLDFNTIGEISELQFEWVIDPENGPTEYSKADKDWTVEYTLGSLTSSFGASYEWKEYDGWKGSVVLNGSVWSGEYDFQDQWEGYGPTITQREVIQMEGISFKAIWYPWDNNWVGVFAGIAYNDLQYSTKYTLHDWTQNPSTNPSYPETGVVINNETYMVNINDHVTGEVEWQDKVTPIFGVRIGNSFNSDKHFTMFMDIGVAKIGGISGNSDFNISNLTTEDKQAVRHELEEWVATQLDKYEKYDMIPLINLGVSWRF